MNKEKISEIIGGIDEKYVAEASSFASGAAETDMPAAERAGAVQVYVLSAGHFGVEARADLQHGGNSSVDVDISRGGSRHAAEELEKRAFPDICITHNRNGYTVFNGVT